MPDTASAIAHLYRLLGFPKDASPPAILSLADLQAWKPRAEQIARALKSEAVEIARLLVEVAEHSGDPTSTAYAWWICGNIHHNLGAMKQADDAYRQADMLYTQLGDPLSAARMSVGWVHVLGELGESAKALQCADRAELALRASNDATDAVRLAHLYGNRGIVYEQIGRLVDALADYKHKLAFFQNLPDPTPEAIMDEASVLNDIGIVHALLGQYNDAERILQSALDRMSSNADLPFIDADRTLVLMNVAWLKALRHSPPAIVRRAFQQARASRDRLAEQSERIHFTRIELDEANYLIRNGRWQEIDRTGIVMLRDRLIEQRVEFDAAYAALLVGQIDYYAGRYTAALAVFAQVTTEYLEKTPTLAYLAHLWEARACRALNDRVRAERALNAAIELIEQTRRRLTLDDYRAGFLEDKLIAYQELIDLHLARRAFDKSLAVSEHSKARTLAEAIASNAQREDAAAHLAEPSVAADERAARRFSTPTFAATLPTDTLAISYVEVHEHVWAFMVDAQGMVAPPIDLGARLSRADLENGLRKIQRIAHAPEFSPEVIEQQTALAQTALTAWWAAFLAPLQPWLDHCSKVLIAPDGLMNALPFACLYDASRQRYFCETHEITSTPSLALWPVLSTPGKLDDGAPDRKVLVVGNSSKNGAPGALPATVGEAHTVARLFAAPLVLTEHDATIAHFVRAAPQSQLIYIAAHGEHHLAEPSASFIELADGPLRVRDILALQLANPVVILNACDTSRGYLIGNELMGLVRSFFYAGASAIVAAQWQVEDAAAADLMTQIVHELLAGKSLAHALQRAQQTFIHRPGRVAHPFFWGAVSVSGAGNLRIDVGDAL